jgi:hypothetical protein
MVVTLSLFCVAGGTRSVHEVWTVKLTGEGGTQRFDRVAVWLWQRQEGVAFLSPERLLLYQVNRRRLPATLGPRGPSGGAGNFVLVTRVFDVKTGIEIKRAQFLTTADFSSVLPTHDGKFIVRAGAVLALYDPDFHPLVARKLPSGTDAAVDYWDISVTPSGKQLALVHQQRFGEIKGDGEFIESKSEADVEILNADTFQALKTFHLPHYLPTFYAQDQSLLTTVSHKPFANTEFGVMDFSGNWTPLRPSWADPKSRCLSNVHLLEHDLMVASGCSPAVVFSATEKLLTVPASNGGYFFSVKGGSRYVAIMTAELGMTPLGASMQPRTIELYDLQSRERVASVKLEKTSATFALSAEGLLAVVDGDEVKLYQPD